MAFSGLSGVKTGPVYPAAPAECGVTGGRYDNDWASRMACAIRAGRPVHKRMYRPVAVVIDDEQGSTVGLLDEYGASPLRQRPAQPGVAGWRTVDTYYHYMLVLAVSSLAIRSQAMTALLAVHLPGFICRRCGRHTLGSSATGTIGDGRESSPEACRALPLGRCSARRQESRSGLA
jgi:hypothetical protein